MNEEKLCEIINDYADGLEALAIKLKREVAELAKRKDQPKQKTDSPADTEEIYYERQTGQKGEFEKSEDVNNPRFQALKQTLQSHSGKMSADGYFIWLYPDGKVIGRKRKA
jgi:hypothetical protein